MEGLAALGVAAAAIQFVHFAAKISGKAHEYHHSLNGMIKEHIDLSDLAENFQQLGERLGDSVATSSLQTALSKEDEALISVAQRCKRLCEAGQNVLARLSTSRHNRKFESLRQALKAVWSEKDVSDWLHRIQLARDELALHLLVVLNNHVNDSHCAIIQQNQSSETNVLGAIDDLRIQNSDLLNLLTLLSNDLRAGPAGQQVLLDNDWRKTHEKEIHELVEIVCKSKEIDSDSAKVEQHAVDAILDGLHFEFMDEREMLIKQAHRETFQWLFQIDVSATQHWTSFTDWLSHDDRDDNLYWISGKAGSGKSTLMKFIHEHERTKELLRRWSDSRRLLTVSCFFWYSGSQLQRSLNGLLRTLLYQILTQAKQITKNACPARFRSCVVGRTAQAEWTDSEALNALEIALQQLAKEYKTCIFIDGLDEYKGDINEQDELVALIGRLRKFQDVKFCVSSRPWPVYHDAFQKGPSLELHRLTAPDIAKYVDETLVKSVPFTSIVGVTAIEHRQIVNRILDKAKGVFLWVVLVVRDLLQHLRDGDDLSDLGRRIDAVPSDLHKYFTSMLSRLDDRYVEEACYLFTVALTGKYGKNLATYSFVLEEQDFFASPEVVRGLSQQQLSRRCERMERKLSSRCLGLLEPKSPVLTQLEYELRDVDFLHTSVRDWLESGVLQDLQVQMQRASTRSDPFNAHQTLAAAYVAKVAISASVGDRFLGWKVHLACSYAFDYEAMTGLTLTRTLDTLDSILFGSSEAHGCKTLSPESGGAQALYKNTYNSFLSIAFQEKLFLYWTDKISKSCASKAGEGSGNHLVQQGLQDALGFGAERYNPTGISWYGSLPMPSLRHLRFVLSLGAKPNGRVFKGEESIWEHFMHLRGLDCDEYREATKLMISHGAARSPPNGDPYYNPRSIFSDRHGEDFANELDGLWDEYERKERRKAELKSTGSC